MNFTQDAKAEARFIRTQFYTRAFRTTVLDHVAERFLSHSKQAQSHILRNV